MARYRLPRHARIVRCALSDCQLRPQSCSAVVTIAVAIHGAAAAGTGETAPSWLRGSNPLAADPVKFVKRLATASEGREAMSRADNISVSSKRFAAGRINGTLGRLSPSSRRSFRRRFAPYLGTILALSLFGG